MNNFYVYAYYDSTISSEEPIYVGKGRKNRYLEHFDQCLTGRTHFHRRLLAMIRVGNSPVIKKLAEGLSEDEAFRLEKELIARYGRHDLGTGCLCNHTDGGQGTSGRTHSEETRRKISISNLGREISIDARVSTARTLSGRKTPAATREKIRASSPSSLSVCAYDLRTGETVKVYPSMSSVREDGYQYQNVYKVLRGIYRSHGGLGWRLT